MPKEKNDITLSRSIVDVAINGFIKSLLDFLKIDSSRPKALEAEISWVIEDIARSYGFDVALTSSLAAKV